MKIVSSLNILPEELFDEIISFMNAFSLGNLSQTSKYFQEKIKKNQKVWVKLYEQKIIKKITLPKIVLFLNICFKEFYIQRFYKMKEVLEQANNHSADPDEILVDYDEIWNLIHFLDLITAIELKYSYGFSSFIEKLRLRMKYLMHLKSCTEIPSKLKLKENINVENPILKSNILLENAILIKFKMINEEKRVDFLASFKLHSLDKSKTLDLEVLSLTKGFLSDNEGCIELDRLMCIRIINSKLKNQSTLAPNFNTDQSFYSYSVADEYKGRDDDIYLNLQYLYDNQSNLEMIQSVLDFLVLDTEADTNMICDFYHPNLDQY